MSEYITLSVGGGGKDTNSFIKDIILKNFDNEILANMGDASILCLEDFKSESGILSYTTDSFVINPNFFNGGNIGKLSICGTVNDLAVSGAIPLYLTFALIIPEGYKLDDLKKIVESAAMEAKKAGVKIVAGDTKVVDRNSLDSVIINTSGVGRIVKNLNDFMQISESDDIILTSDIARHGMSIMLSRQDYGFQGEIESDCATLNRMLESVYKYDVKFMRDATRGGVAAVLNEIAEKTGLGFLVRESDLPLMENVSMVCDTLGFDPLTVANEGVAVIICNKSDSTKVISELQKFETGKNAAIIGKVMKDNEIKNRVVLETFAGGRRLIDMPPGELLPRIC